MGAGGSAVNRANELTRRANALRAEANRYTAAAAAERDVAAALMALAGPGWQLLVDRLWPGSRSANVDMVLIGPPGVFVIDVKNWRYPPTVAGGHLMSADDVRDNEIEKLLTLTRLTEDTLVHINMLAGVEPLMVFAGHRVDARLDRVRLLGVREVVPALRAMPARLRAGQVEAATDRIAQVFPAYETVDTQPASSPSSPAVDDALFTVEEVVEADLRAARAQPVEDWMTFLHPDQVKLTRREWGGPARISGAAGTGKTVVGLHRAIHLAKRSVGRILYVTFANNLPKVQARLIERIAPAVVGRIQFTSLHAWARHLLTQRGRAVNLGPAEDCFSRSWLSHGRVTILSDVDASPTYWHDEITYVIKGRDIRTLDQYLAIPRIGRRMALGQSQREAVWVLYERYRAMLRERAAHDFNDLLAMALDEVEREPVSPPYAGVIADEVQDLTLVGVRLLHAISGDEPNGLLLIGDCRQAVHPGGYRLLDAGITIRGGRAEVLHVNYRNAGVILDKACAVLANDTFDDIDGSTAVGRPDVDVEYRTGNVEEVIAPSAAEHDAALVAAVRVLQRPADDDGQAFGDAAVLCATKRQVEHYRRLLRNAGVPVQALDDYDGTPNGAVKVGTYVRAKGLEFKEVFLPDHRRGMREARNDHSTTSDRVAIANRQVFVAMTRARDRLWLGDLSNGA